jgi:uncharacterized coiled-coil protein SlyX
LFNLEQKNYTMKKFIQSSILLLGLSTAIMAQVTTAGKYVPKVIKDTAKVDPSLRGQFQQIVSKSKTMYGYKLINPDRLSSWYRGVNDTLVKERKQLRTAKSKIAEQEKAITDLKTQITGNETSIASTNAKMNEISFLGISFTKSSYNTIVWSLIIVLALALAIIIFRSAKLLHEAKYRTGLYDEIAQEYQNYKTKANDKEKKLARELQDERNKLEELRSRGR